MIMIRLIAFAGLMCGVFILMQMTPMEFTNGIFDALTKKPKNIKNDILKETGKKRVPAIIREIKETQEIMESIGKGKKFPMVCAGSLLMFAIGAVISLMFNNWFMLPVMAVGFMFLPFWYIRITQTNYKRDIAQELETSLSIVTTAYLRTEDIQTAIGENIDYINQPVAGVFREFLSRTALIDPDIDAAIKIMKTRIQNDVFNEWCDALLVCQTDRSLKSTLTPIVTKLSDTRIVNGELDNMVSEPRKEFIMMAALVVANIPLLYMINKSWYATLVHTVLGQILMAACAGAIFISLSFVVKLTQPIEYRR